jgi:hypothetical protein
VVSRLLLAGPDIMPTISGMPNLLGAAQRSVIKDVDFGAQNLVMTCPNWSNSFSHSKNMDVHDPIEGVLLILSLRVDSSQ